MQRAERTEDGYHTYYFQMTQVPKKAGKKHKATAVQVQGMQARHAGSADSFDAPAPRPAAKPQAPKLRPVRIGEDVYMVPEAAEEQPKAGPGPGERFFVGLAEWIGGAIDKGLGR